MASQLLVRCYNVGLGDCIYLRIPDTGRDVHVLIDCGNKFGSLDLLGERIAELKQELPDAGGGKKRLDLLVVSHPHEDHHKGFEEAFFGDLVIKNIWLSPAFDRLNPKAQGFTALQDAARRGLTGLAETAFGDLKDEVDELLSLNKDEAIDMLNNLLPERNGIKPLYVSADTPAEQLKLFTDPKISFKVIGPMGDIDRYYLGGDGLDNTGSGLTGQALAEGETGTSNLAGVDLAASYRAMFPELGAAAEKLPTNISFQDFRQLRSRARANVLAVAEVAGHAVNNLSVVLLLDWHGKRLLFPGDAEWSSGRKGDIKPKPGSSNGSWNVIWQERQAELSKPLDFLKIGHHGSENATPWTGEKLKTGEAHPINQIIDAMLPLPVGKKRPKARAIASTLRTTRWPTIPDGALLAEIGKRVANARMNYTEPPSPRSVPDKTRQPQRTDLESQATGTPATPVEFIEVKIKR